MKRITSRHDAYLNINFMHQYAILSFNKFARSVKRVDNYNKRKIKQSEKNKQEKTIITMQRDEKYSLRKKLNQWKFQDKLISHTIISFFNG